MTAYLSRWLSVWTATYLDPLDMVYISVVAEVIVSTRTRTSHSSRWDVSNSFSKDNEAELSCDISQNRHLNSAEYCSCPPSASLNNSVKANAFLKSTHRYSLAYLRPQSIITLNLMSLHNDNPAAQVFMTCGELIYQEEQYIREYAAVSVCDLAMYCRRANFLFSTMIFPLILNVGRCSSGYALCTQALNRPYPFLIISHLTPPVMAVSTSQVTRSQLGHLRKPIKPCTLFRRQTVHPPADSFGSMPK